MGNTKISPFSRMAANGFVGLTLFIILVESNIVYWTVGGFSVSAYLTLITPFLFVLFVASQTFKNPGLGIYLLLRLAPFLALGVMGLLSLGLNFRLEGLQNVLAFAVFTLGIAAFALAPGDIVQRAVQVWVPTFAAFAAIAFIATQVIDTETRFGVEFFSPRQYAMVAVISLAAAVSAPPINRLIQISPYLIVASIIFSASRTTAAIGVLILMTLIVQGNPGIGTRLKKLGTILFFLVVSGAIAVLTSRDVQERVISGGGAEQTAILSDSGRFQAWLEFLTMPNTAVDWIFGLGSGASAEYGQREIPFFPQTLNEYLRFLIDNGAIGLGVFVLGILWLLMKLPLWGKLSNHSSKAAGLAVVGLALISLTDGAFYSYFVVLPASLLVGNGLRSLYTISQATSADSRLG